VEPSAAWPIDDQAEAPGSLLGKQFVEVLNGLILDEAAKIEAHEPPRTGSTSSALRKRMRQASTLTKELPLVPRPHGATGSAPRGQLLYTVLPRLPRLRACTTLHSGGLLNRHLHPITLL
jgi:hypothetical protein